MTQSVCKVSKQNKDHASCKSSTLLYELYEFEAMQEDLCAQQRLRSPLAIDKSVYVHNKGN